MKGPLSVSSTVDGYRRKDGVEINDGSFVYLSNEHITVLL